MSTPLLNSPRARAVLLWQQAVALSHRYPELGSRLRPAWWERAGERELVQALCDWRDALDLTVPTAGGELERARREFDFHIHLSRACGLLTSQPGRGVFDAETELAAYYAYADSLPDTRAAS